MRGLAAGAILLAAVAVSPAGAVECRSSQGDDGHWMWRNVDGRRCWYAGHRMISKSRLHWPERRAEPEKKVRRPAPERAPVHADPPPPDRRADEGRSAEAQPPPPPAPPAAPPAAPPEAVQYGEALPIEASPLASYRPALLDLRPVAAPPRPSRAMDDEAGEAPPIPEGVRPALAAGYAIMALGATLTVITVALGIKGAAGR